jgi:hypothetical protein
MVENTEDDRDLIFFDTFSHDLHEVRNFASFKTVELFYLSCV